MAGDADLSSVEAELKHAQLQKTNLEKEEIELRIRNVETPRERAIKLAVTVLVPLVTACTAIAAAYLGLVSVQDERDRLSEERAALLKLKEADFLKTKSERALSLLNSANSSGANPAVLLSALRDLLLGGAQPTANLTNVVAGLVGHQDSLVSQTAAEVLIHTGSPEMVAAAVSNRLTEQFGGTRLELIRVLSTLPAHKIEVDLYHLLFAKDAVASGAAVVFTAQAPAFSWSRINLLDQTKSEEERSALFDLVLLQQNAQIRAAALAKPLDALFRKDMLRTGSLEARAACYFLQTAGTLPGGSAFRVRLNQAKDIHPFNKMIVHAILAEREDREAVAKIYESLKSSLPDLAKLNRPVLETIAKRLGLERELARLRYDPAANETYESSTISSHLDWNSVPTDVLKKWAGLDGAAKPSEFSKRAFAARARDELVKRIGEQAIPFFEQELAFTPSQLVPYWAQFDTYHPKILVFAKAVMTGPTKERADTSSVFRVLDKLKDTDLVSKILQVMSADTFEFVASSMDVTEHGDEITAILSEIKDKQQIDKVGAALATLHRRPNEISKSWLEPALGDALTKLEQIDLAAYSQNPDRFAQNILDAVVLTAAIAGQEAGRNWEIRLQKALSNLPTILWTDRFAMIRVDRGSIGLRARIYAPLYQQKLPEFLERYRLGSCRSDDDGVPAYNSVPYRAVIAKYVLGIK